MKKTAEETLVFNAGNIAGINTLGQLKALGYVSKSLKDELRANLKKAIVNDTPRFQGVLGYEDTVIPQIENAILAGHNINLLGLRGQAKTRIARSLCSLLDEYVPVIAGSPLNEEPLNPITKSSKKLLEEKGDDTPISWWAAADRYVEKLATPDVTVADLIGDIDPIKAANLKLSFSDEEAIHYGLVPRANRGIFVINELPDLQAKIQVALFNVLQESDIQIRGFKVRMPLDTYFVFTANPEDYTNRGSIITPLKDRIQAQIVTHYPDSIAVGMQITKQEAKITAEQKQVVFVPEIIEELIEQIAVEARQSEYVDVKSGVSARLTISAYENVVSQCYRRALALGSKEEIVRIADLFMVVPAINGKIELVYEGEQEGSVNVANNLICAALRSLAAVYFKDLEKKKGGVNKSPYLSITNWFSENPEGLNLLLNATTKDYSKSLEKVDGLKEIAQKQFKGSYKDKELVLIMEFLLHALAQYSQLDAKLIVGKSFKFGDILSGYFNFDDGAGLN